MGTYLTLDSLSSYKISFDFSNSVWQIVSKWDFLAKKTIGAQFINASDSISATIAEGFGRYSKKDKIRFYRMSSGSVYECKDWLEKAKIRKLIDANTYDSLAKHLNNLPKELNHLIKFTNERLEE